MEGRERADLRTQALGERGHLGAASGRGRGLGNYQRPNASRPNAEVIVVPVKDVARIIGRGGSRIREHQDSCGACMWVKKDDADNYFETKIELPGPEEARRKARELIDAIVHPPEEPVCSSKCEEPPPLLNWDKLLAKCDKETKRRWASLAPVIKHFYIEDPQVASMSVEEMVAFRAANNNIVVKYLGPEQEPPPDVATNPVTTFEQAFSNYREILEEIQKRSSRGHLQYRAMPGQSCFKIKTSSESHRQVQGRLWHCCCQP
ncbi:hypothetical protein HPB49_014039 [Dermacentor silvarum]|uniref:Uncharacterized protein n=1 Tax=Dermacentor silvarum TaxID=543639 RepID=A0ACB8DDJ2_DERSI|nr:hypothetical protein HPB49_014039 [Dermacentor silvarum]